MHVSSAPVEYFVCLDNLEKAKRGSKIFLELVVLKGLHGSDFRLGF